MIEFKEVSFSYAREGNENNLCDVNCRIRTGEFVLLCGESGCGKTTFTRLVNGLIPHYYEGSLQGEVLVNGHPVGRLPLFQTSEMVGSVFQNPRSQFFNVDTTSEIAFGCENKGLPAEEIEERIKETVRQFSIEHLMNRSIFELSGGEKQKIACASVSACYPDIFVLDEPSSNLDPRAIEELRQLLQFWKQCGKTIIIAEHRLHFLGELADRVFYLKDGRLEKEFTASEIKNLSADELTQLGLRPLSLMELSGGGWSALQYREGEFILEDFSYSYKGKKQALNINSMNLPRGSIMAVIGHNGAGKTTFARCFCGLENRFKGKLVCDNKIWKNKERLKNTYMVMQDVNHQLFTESVLDEVLLSMDEPCEEEVEKILQMLDIEEYKESHPMSLSGGQKQRVAIAGALAAQKEWIFLDEPTSGLDLRHMQEVIEIIHRLKELGKTILVISHDPELILGCCSHVLHFEGGRLEEQYPLDENGVKKIKSFFDIHSSKMM